jgi:hypothetical protein
MTNKARRKWEAMCKKHGWGKPDSYEAAHKYQVYAKEQREKLERQQVLATDWQYDPFI